MSESTAGSRPQQAGGVLSAEPLPPRQAGGAPGAGSMPREIAPEWVDRFLGSDPGLTRLRTALQAVVTIGTAMLAEWLFARLTGALHVPVPAGLPQAEAAGLAALNHGLLVIAIVLGAVVGMLASFAGLMFARPRDLLISLALVPVPMIAGLAIGLALGSYRVLALASLAVVLAAGTYARRYGPRGFMGGMLLFMGNFFGFFLHGEVTAGDLGWLSAEIALGAAVAIAAQFTLFYPSRKAALRRTLRSCTARARDVARRSQEVFGEPGGPARARAARRLRRRLVRLNEAALMVDAQLADPAAIPAGWSPALVQQCLFDAELCLTNLARFTERLAGLPLPDAIRGLIREALAAVARRDLPAADRAGRDLLARLRAPGAGPGGRAGTAAAGLEALAQADPAGPVVLHRLALSVRGVAAASRAWRRAAPAGPGPGSARPSPAEPADSPVTLAAGWLPGSAKVSEAASLQGGPGRGFWGRIRLAPYERVAIQMGVAVAGAIFFGDLLSGRRFYWAVIAAFVTFMGAHNAGEQLRKSLYRVAGTVVGVLLGALGAHLVGARTAAAVAVILISLFVGLYLMRISYVFMVIGITIMVSQLYVQLGEFSDALLVLRLEETALGAAVAAVTVLCVLPLRSGRVAGVAAAQFVEAVAALTAQASGRLADPACPAAPLRAAAREVDVAYQALLSAVVPQGLPFIGAASTRRARFLYSASAARHYARNLTVDAAGAADLGPGQRQALGAASAQLAGSLAQLARAAQDRAAPRRYIRSAALFYLVSPGLPDDDVLAPWQLAVRDLQLIDGAMAAVAQSAGMSVRALEDGPGPLAGQPAAALPPGPGIRNR